MNEQIKGGGPAFPVIDSDSTGLHCREPGMTLRDYFAAKAMQGLCASGYSGMGTDAALATDSYAIADAMLAAREVKA